jgi:hypothetical protein
MPEPSMRLHPLPPNVRCPRCGAGIAFTRVRTFADLYTCTSGDRCRCQILHFRSQKTKGCGYCTLSTGGAFGAWTVCDMPAVKEK